MINSLSAQAKVEQKQLVVLFQDEARFGRVQDPKRCWVPKKNRPLVKAQEFTRKELQVIYALSPRGASLVVEEMIAKHIIKAVDTKTQRNVVYEAFEILQTVLN